MNDGPLELLSRQSRPEPLDPAGRFAPQRELQQLADLQQAQLQGVVGIVRVVGHAVGRIDDLHLDERLPDRLLVPAGCLTFERFQY